MKVNFRTRHNTEEELKTVSLLEDTLKRHPELSGYIFSSSVIIDGTVQPPHSHPVITLNCKDNDSLSLLLSNFIHEQLHHFLHDRDSKLEDAVNELKKTYKNAPIGYPHGANNEFWTYAHLILCSLEQMILKEVFGKEFAHESLTYWQTHHYTWIYKKISTDYDSLIKTAKRYDLLPTGQHG